MTSGDYIPLDRVADYTDRVTVDDLGLAPEYEPSNVGLSVHAVERALDWGGVSTFSVKTDTETPIGIGYLEPGVWERMTIGRWQTDGPRLHTSEIKHDEVVAPHLRDRRRDYTTSHANATIFKQAVKKTTWLDRNYWRNGELDEGAYLHYTNRALQIAVADATINNLARGRRSILERFKSLGLVIATNPHLIPSGHVSPKLAATPILVNGVDAAYEHLINGRHVGERQWSAFFGALPYDRIMMVRRHAGQTLLKELS